MTIAQVRNDELVALLGADLLTLRDRNVALCLVREAWLDVGAETGVAFPLTRLNMATGCFEVGAGGVDVTLLQAGVYWVAIDAIAQNAGGTGAAELALWLQADTGSGWANVAAGRAVAAVPATVNWQANLSRTTLLWLGVGAKLRVRAQRMQGADALGLAAGMASLQVVRLVGLE